MSDETLSFQSNMEQFGAMTQTMASVVGQYHTGLSAVHPPLNQDLIDALVKDFATLYWRKVLFPNG